MLAAWAARFAPDDPLDGLEVGERPEPVAPAGWATVSVRSAALNHHDLWTLRGVGISADRLPMVLGCDAAGVDETGAPVIVHAVVPSDGWVGDETMDPRRTLLSELHQGTLAERVVVPRRNLVAMPDGMSFDEAACLPTAWLTAYRMLVAGGTPPGSTVLVQGAGGGVATALTALGRVMGLRVWVTGRSEAKRARAVDLGADAAFEPDARLPERVDAVMETVGAATWAHSVRSLRPGGTIVVSGATSGDPAPMELSRIFFRQLRVVGSTMGTREDLVRLAALCRLRGVRPPVDATYPLADARSALARLAEGNLFGKLVLRVSDADPEVVDA